MENETQPGDPVAAALPEQATPKGSDRDAPEARDRYELAIDVDSESTHALVVRLVGRDRRVLELGPATGHMTRVLRDRGCTVVGVEVDPQMADVAGRYTERLILGDLDELDLDAELESDRFDVIVAADVLEHLKDPLAALRQLRRFLKQKGHFVISLPNIAHGSVRLALLQGHFEYRDLGLLDRTHLRFFTRESIGQLLDQAELAVAEIYHQPLDIDAAEIPFDAAAVPQDVLRQLADDPEARTYQFVIKAVALDTPGLRELQGRLRELAHENAQLRELAHENARLRESEKEVTTHGTARESQLRAALIDAHDQLMRRDEDIRRLHEGITDVDAALAAAREEITDVHAALAAAQEDARRLRVRLERITGSPPIRAYQALSTLPGLRELRAARTAAYRRAAGETARSGAPASGGGPVRPPAASHSMPPTPLERS